MKTFNRLVGILAVAALVPATSLADGDTPFLATVAIERAPGSIGPLDGPALSTLHVADPARTASSLANVDGIEVIDVSDATVRIRAAARPTISGSVSDLERRSTWVIDFDEAAVQALVDELRAANEQPATPAGLEYFVFEHIDNKSYSRSFDLASRVAASGEGDCTEHAVLLAALARANGYAARVVFGNLVLELDTDLLAFGHAWTEIYSDGAWQIRDATMPGNDPALRHARYIPLGSLADEGPAYVLSLVETMSAMPARISNVGMEP
jgi:hypothetical protein